MAKINKNSISPGTYQRRSRSMFWEFEIGLAEAVLKSDPESMDAHHMLGHALTRSGRHKDALEIDRKVVRLTPNDPVARYNLACSYSNLGFLDEALKEIRAAIRLGYIDAKAMARDPDLKNLRKDPRFQDILARLSPQNS